MKMKDTRTKRFEIRLTEEEYQLLLLCADYIGRSPTQFIRLLLRSSFTELRSRISVEGVDHENK